MKDTGCLTSHQTIDFLTQATPSGPTIIVFSSRERAVRQDPPYLKQCIHEWNSF